MSVSRRVIFGWVLPRATMSNDWISGTPARIIVESWRVKTAMSFCLIALPPLMRRFLTLLTRMPWRRRLAPTTASPPARISPRTTLPFLSLPSHSKTSSLMFFAAVAVAMMSSKVGLLFVGDRDHFFQRRDAGTHLDQPGLAQVSHALALGLHGDIHRGALRQDDALDVFGDRHHLVDADAALVAVVARRAADRAVRAPGAVELLFGEAGLEHRVARVVGLRLAGLAQLAGQAL